MRFITLILLVVIFNPSQINAQNRWFIKAGIIYSTFKDLDQGEKIDPLSKAGYGIGREWSFPNNFYLSASFTVMEKGGIIRDKTIRPANIDATEVYYNDIHVRIQYWEIPIIYKHGFYIGSKFNVKLCSGITISLPVKDYSKIKKTKYGFSISYNENRDVDYGQLRDSGFGNNPIDFIFNFGFEMAYIHYAIGFNYALDNREIIWVDSISEMNRTMHSYQFFLIYYL